MKRKKNFKIGDKIAYSVQFLQSIGEKTGDMPHARGEITELKEYSSNFVIAKIKWYNFPDGPEGVNTFNLAKVGVNADFCQC